MQILDKSSESQSKVIRYAFFDGDNIGNAIKNLLNSGRVKEAIHLSESIKLAIFKIEIFVESTSGAELIFSGGDDILIKYNYMKNEYIFLEKILSIFNSFTGLSMSCGVGDSANQALLNLMKIKNKDKGGILMTSKRLEIEDNLMPTKLYIFATSENPDPYINVIAHCAANYRDLNHVTLIGIMEDRGKRLSETDKLKNISKKISDLLDALSEGKYSKKIDDPQTLLDIDMEPADRQRYMALKGLTLETKVLDYQFLDREISNLIYSSNPFEYIFDVTAFAKGYLVDVYTILRFKNISSIHSLEIFKEPNFDEKDLIHNLIYRKTYAFTCLAETLHTRSKIVVNESSIVSESEFNRLQSYCQMLENERNNLEHKTSNNFAKFWSLAYGFILVCLFLFSFWIVNQKGGWDWLEPTIYIVTFLWYLFNFVLQVISTGKFPSFNPRDLFLSLRDWKKKKLEQARSTNIRK
ncbi:mCpol domain-containing protein [Baaleninema simplex]|uniref:mCpol domain-containing protein n=1 Tax=Baaleninema simplex TaxID=2862350 RepID=UPI000346AFD7|nr:mCpol domain-containing protein [Baaleninema simplex]